MTWGLNREPHDYVLYSPTRRYSMPPCMRMVGELPSSGYTSLYGVTEDTAKALHACGTAAGFKGSVWASRLWVDIDSYETADNVETYLRAIGVNYVAYDSGGKGAHFGILRDTGPSHLLPLQDKAWVTKQIPEADLSIYTHLHLFRLPGTVHEDTGRKKILINSCEGTALVLPPLPRSIHQPSTTPVMSHGSGSPLTSSRVKYWSRPVLAGKRHRALLKLAGALRDDAGVGLDVALWWVEEVNRTYAEPKEPEKVTEIVRWVYGQR